MAFAALLALVATRQQHFPREFQLTVFGVDTNQFYLDHIPLFETGLLHGFVTFVANLRDVQQTVLARQNLYESTEGNNRTDLTVVNLSDFRDRNNLFDTSQCRIQSTFIFTKDIHISFVILFGDGNGGTGLFLDLLDHFTTRADYSTDKLLRNRDLDDTRYERFVVCPWFRNRLKNLAENVHTALFCLFESLSQHLV